MKIVRLEGNGLKKYYFDSKDELQAKITQWKKEFIRDNKVYKSTDRAYMEYAKELDDLYDRYLFENGIVEHDITRNMRLAKERRELGFKWDENEQT